MGGTLKTKRCKISDVFDKLECKLSPVSKVRFKELKEISIKEKLVKNRMKS